MVESALFFAIGFLCAAMLAIFAAPAVSRRAMRLANARARLQAPLSESQARAERDALRAIHAVEVVRMEKKVAAAEWERAVATTDLSRQINRMAKLGEQLDAKAEDIRIRDDRIDAAEAATRSIEADSSAKDIVLWDMTAQRDAAQERLAQARSSILALETQIDSSRFEIATQGTKVSALELELADLRSGKRHFGGESIQGLEERLRRSEAAREAQTLELARHMRNSAEREAALSAARTASDSLTRRLEVGERRAHEVEEDLRTKAQTLSTTSATAAGALAVERAERLNLKREVEALQERLREATASAEAMTKGDAALRLAIAKLGRDIVRSRSPQDDEPHGAAQVVNFTRREPIS